MEVRKKNIHFQDTIVIYFDKKDGVWIGHSLETDQIGTGGDVLQALTGALKAVQVTCSAAAEDETLVYRRKAPAKIQRMAKTARDLPRELYEIAHKRVHGTWPEDIPVDVPGDNKTFKTKVSQEDLSCA